MKKVFKILGTIFAVIIGIVIIAVVSVTVFVTSFNKEPEVRYDVSLKADDGAITVMDFNIRSFDLKNFGDKFWFNRAELIMTQIAKVKPDIVCLQEVNEIQKPYFDSALVGYTSVFEPRETKVFGEGSPIYFSTTKYLVADSGTFWLSEDPAKESKSWGGAKRICTYVVLQDKETKREFAVFNTQLDDKSELARVNGMDLIITKMAEIAGDKPALLFGDMNDVQESDMYKKATQSYADIKTIAKETEDPDITYNAFGENGKGKEIDYCFATADKIDPLSYQVLDEKVDGKYASDHYAIVVKFNLM